MDRRSKFALCLLAGSLLTAHSSEMHGQEQPPAAQAPAPQQHPAASPAVARTVVLLDPAHGGTDPGADLGNKIAEKDITLAIASKLRAALAAQGFAVIMTREADPSDAVTADQRAALANRSRAAACLSLHATRSGSGVHVYTSALQPVDATTDNALVPTRWDTAQENFVARSVQLANTLKTALNAAALPTATDTATVPPLDSLSCPAVAIEFAPLNTLQSAGKNIDDATYQSSAIRAIAAAITKSRTDTATPPPPTKEAQ